MKILAIGFYSKSNLGDQLFIEAYLHLFPEFQFTFSDHITEKLFAQCDAIFIGGGSFLDGQPNVNKDLLERLPEKPILYLGIGAETNIHLWHKFLLKKAALIYTRSISAIDKLTALNPQTFYCQDLAYSLSEKTEFSPRQEKTILFLPNAYTVSKWDDMAWKHQAWEYFKSECSQAFESLIDLGYKIDILPMCQNNKHNDLYAGIEITNKMKKNLPKFLPFIEHDFIDLIKLISSYSIVISQRYHGLVLADMARTPCLNIHHHDKLKEFKSTKNLDYYRTSKDSIVQGVEDAIFLGSQTLPIKSDTFTSFKEKVTNTLKG